MARYIDAEALNETLKIRAEGVFGSSLNGFMVACAITHVMKIIKEFPAADVAEVRHGEWRTYNYLVSNELLDENEYQVCSECAYRRRNKSPYCPNCGARMDGKQK